MNFKVLIEQGGYRRVKGAVGVKTLPFAEKERVLSYPVKLKKLATNQYTPYHVRNTMGPPHQL